jgi:hypothetical protein
MGRRALPQIRNPRGHSSSSTHRFDVSQYLFGKRAKPARVDRVPCLPKWSKSKPKTMAFGAKILRICLTAMVALAIAVPISGPLFVVLWPALYWAWHLIGRRRAARGLRTPLWIPATKSPAAAVTIPAARLQRLARTFGTVFAALLGAGLVLVFVNVELSEHQAKESRVSIHEGMAVGDVLQLEPRGNIFPACAGLPADLTFNPGTRKFTYHDTATNAEREISDSDAVALLQQNLGDGDRWCLEYFFGGAIEHFSFKVVFDRNGRVREVTPIFGSFE